MIHNAGAQQEPIGSRWQGEQVAFSVAKINTSWRPSVVQGCTTIVFMPLPAHNVTFFPPMLLFVIVIENRTRVRFSYHMFIFYRNLLILFIRPDVFANTKPLYFFITVFLTPASYALVHNIDLNMVNLFLSRLLTSMFTFPCRSNESMTSDIIRTHVRSADFI